MIGLINPEDPLNVTVFVISLRELFTCDYFEHHIGKRPGNQDLQERHQTRIYAQFSKRKKRDILSDS